MIQEIVDVLKELKSMTTSVCRKAEEDKGRFLDDPINWASLRCTEACLSINEYGHARYTVYVSKASPDANRLKDFIRDELKAKGIEEVEVITEW